MPPEGNVQIAAFGFEVPGVGSGAFAVEIGAKGEAAKLLAIHYSLQRVFPETGQRYQMALSSNPNHLLTQPPTEIAMLTDKALYAFWAFTHEEIVGAAGVWQAIQNTQVIPLYGLIRPRRQIFVFRSFAETTTNLRIEIYYTPISLGKTELDTLDLKYGKYRRGA